MNLQSTQIGGKGSIRRKKKKNWKCFFREKNKRVSHI